jgi:hypothetical protein
LTRAGHSVSMEDAILYQGYYDDDDDDDDDDR